MSQFGIQMIGAREPIYVSEDFETLAELRSWLTSASLAEVRLVGQSARTALIGHRHIVAVSGPNSPGVTELFKS